jgi:hypothetical protein
MTAQKNCEAMNICSKCGRVILNDTTVYFEDPAAVAAWRRFRESPRDSEAWDEWKAFCDSATGSDLNRVVRFFTERPNVSPERIDVGHFFSGSAIADRIRIAVRDQALNDDGAVSFEIAKEHYLLRCEHCDHINNLDRPRTFTID